MTSKSTIYSLFLTMAFIFAGCSSNDLIELEDSNAYSWQKHMNIDEFNQLKEGMTYEEVVAVAKGLGTLLEENKYRWSDELLMTQAYVIEFKENKLVSKEVIELRGSSTRDLPEKPPAVPGEPATDLEGDSTTD